MDLLSLKKHLPSIEDGRWVTREELPALQDIRVKARGLSARVVRDAYAAKERALSPDDLVNGRPKAEIMSRIGLEVLAEVALVTVDGLTLDGEPVPMDDIRGMLVKPEYAPLADLLSQASFIVDKTRESKIKAIAGN